MTGLGLGLVGTFLHSALNEKVDPLAPYRYAQGLIRQLIDISGGLDSGLDPVALGGAILSSVRDDMPTSAVVVSVPRGDTLTPLVSKSMGSEDDLNLCEDIAVEAWAVGLPVLHDRVFAFPLNTEAGTVAIVAGLLSNRVDPARLGLEDRIRKLMRRLEASAVHLDTALLFSAFRDAATAEERRRLAREMHDGVAQDIASLGYLVDALAAGTTSSDQMERIEVLRDRISSVVSEIRRSVVTLRTSVGQSESLGTAIGSIARNLSEVSGVPIHVTLDEHTQRLRSEVEAELFRIAQEAMNNAVRHAQASVIDVHCQVHAPQALITVTDNGRGLQEARSTSHGLHIMQERAVLIGAELSISETATGGLSVSVRLPSGGGNHDSGDPAPVHARVGA
jgi:signal transduction histidine kinase